MTDNQDRYSLAAIKKQFDDGAKFPSPSEIQWLVDECERLTRNNRALDAEVARLDKEIRQKDMEFTAAEMELLDVSEALSVCRSQLESTRQAEPPAS